MVSPTMSFSTVNIETIRGDEGEKKNGFDSTLSYSFFEASGNSEIKSHKTSLRSDYKAEKYNAFFVLSNKRGKKGDDLYIDKGFVHLRLMVPILKSKRFTSEAFVQKEYNDFTLLEDRQLGGAGLRSKVFEAPDKYSVYLGLGVMKEREVINLMPTVTTRYSRLTNYLSVKYKINDTLHFTGTGYYQPRPSENDDYRILFDGSLTFKISKHLSFALEVNHRRDSIPPLGVKKDDTEVLNTLKVNF